MDSRTVVQYSKRRNGPSEVTLNHMPFQKLTNRFQNYKAGEPKQINPRGQSRTLTSRFQGCCVMNWFQKGIELDKGRCTNLSYKGPEPFGPIRILKRPKRSSCKRQYHIVKGFPISSFRHSRLTLWTPRVCFGRSSWMTSIGDVFLLLLLPLTRIGSSHPPIPSPHPPVPIKRIK